MNVNSYYKKSLSRQFGVSMAGFIIFFILGSGLLLYFQQSLNKSFKEDRKKIVHLEGISDKISGSFNSAFFDVRGYLALNNEVLLRNAEARESEIISSVRKLENAAFTRSDKEMAEEVREFDSYYFQETLPKVIKDVNEGHKDRVIELAANESTKKVNDFQERLDGYNQELNERLDKRVNQLTKDQTALQIWFLFFILFALLTLYIIIRTMFSRVGKPLAALAAASNEIALGKEAVLPKENREDEIGSLSSAFRKMVSSLQEKEKDLLAQNEELSAHQDELHSQQDELQHALRILRENELNLNRRNELINQISNSLHKQEVLDSIVKSMSELLPADKGLITLVDEDAFASFGVSVSGVQQFRNHIKSGLNVRLLETKKAFTIKREQETAEKGFHEGISYCYDLYLPVLSSRQKTVAIMIFSRYGNPFPDSQLFEYEALAKQIGISLEKIELYEKSEEDRKLNQDIINSVHEGIQLLDSAGTIVQINKQLCDRFFSGKDAAGLTWEEWIALMSPFIVNKHEFSDFILNSIQCQKQEDNEENSLVYSVTDSNQVLKVYCENVFHGKEKVGTVLVHRDITREFEVDQMKSEFVSTVSHELRTPLASVLGFTELMLTKKLKPERQKKYLTTILNEAKRLTDLINDFLDVQRMESGKQSYEKAYAELDLIIERAVEKQQISAVTHKIVLNLDSKENFIWCDQAKLEQVFTNLISNAIKYSPEGERVEIKVYQEDGFVKADVIDFGLGIPEESIDKLFQKFYRVDNSDRRKIGGTGLGLAIVQEIVKAHEGDITVSSLYGKGSTFTVSLPLVSIKKGYEEDVPEKVPAAEQYRVMLIEDDSSLAELLKEELSEHGFSVTWFSKGQEAMTVLKTDVPDAIVLDIMLEKDSIDGWTIIEKIKEDEKLKEVPIFISTALDEKKRGISLGAKEFLVKPYKLSQLSSTIMQTLIKKGKTGQIHVNKD
ncbi:ATP-binding protein [Peribacillus deserti]|uniref:histidine kinase n=1 Tax=Peribacillus deserti TaxID=673318 RepID=A0A2N5M059_9BACI|nr:ATP-binding protein [Peribacillus deserti]PLT27663.1 histidine kinase [Peribacillus deserti]